jgi:hypothetical protein
MRLETKNIFMLFLLFLSCSCASDKEPALAHQPSAGLNNGRQVYSDIKEVLSQCGDRIDYDTLMWVYKEMARSNTHIPNSGDLVSLLIQKKNESPRVDNMILIFAADIIGNSHAAMDNAADLFEAMLMQDQRLNLWVLTYIGDAIGKYEYHIPEGDLLVDLLEQRVAEHSSSAFSKEFFGNHFLPPPKQEYIINYIAGIEDQETRVLERNSYYNLVISGRSEAQIENALRQLQAHEIQGTGKKKPQRPLKYLLLHPGQFESPSVQTEVLSHPTF